jgi:hypothetical protein
MDDEKPDTRHLVLRPKEITPTESPSRPGDGTAISVQLIHRQNQLAEEKASEKRSRGAGPPPADARPAEPRAPVFRPKELTPLDPPAHPGDKNAINVPDILMENQIAEVNSGLADVKQRKKRRSKRNRDFILVVGTLDLAIGIVMRLEPGPFTMVYGLSAITLLTSMAGWTMFVVNDDY